jgi:hypothetical protein
MTDRVRFSDATVVANVVSLIVMLDAAVGVLGVARWHECAFIFGSGDESVAVGWRDHS